MITKSISNLNFFKILDEETREVYHGCNQTWYKTAWQRLSGCGPTTATNLIFYLYQAPQSAESNHHPVSKKDCLLLMEEIWEYVTPSIKGVSSTKMFYQAVLAYAQAKGLPLQYHFLDLPKIKSSRPAFSEVLEFIDESLSKDVPVAFLNLCNGDEQNLDCWHWVTVISLDYEENEGQAFIDILDDGQIKKIDLTLWYQTTTKGGGFVYFTSNP
jgi:hypothetical protein